MFSTHVRTGCYQTHRDDKAKYADVEECYWKGFRVNCIKTSARLLPYCPKGEHFYPARDLVAPDRLLANGKGLDDQPVAL